MISANDSKAAPKAKRIALIIGIVLVLGLAGCAWYVNDYYHADDVALAAVTDEDGAADGVTVRELENGSVVFDAAQPKAGLIFYPGGKVEPEAYAPLLTRFARQGITCVLVKPPFNLAILNMDAADRIKKQFPEIDTWFLAGHSLGGVAASDYLSRHTSQFDGIILLGAYTTADLSGYEGSVILMYGSDDGVMDRTKYAEAKSNLPDDAQETVIEGGNHAFFGNYGAQSGDGAARITRDEQQQITLENLIPAMQTP